MSRLETKLLLRYATYNQWMSSNVILEPGEAAIAVFPSPESTDPPRSFGIKIGDGLHYFYELPWIQALAADVYDWAKNPNPPSPSMIPGLDQYIEEHSSGGGGGSATSGSAYRIIYDNAAQKYILQWFNDTTNEWTNTSSEISFYDVLNRLDTIERWANGAKTNLGNIYDPITAIVYDEVVTYINRLDVSDIAEEHKFVTSVSQVDGKIVITRSILTASDITSGVFTTVQGGTGLTSVDEDQVLIGSPSGNITTKTFVTEINSIDRNNFATTGAIIDYVTEATQGLTHAMHFIGESAVVIDDKQNSRANPQISGYDFTNAQPGDVILANNTQEYIWTGTNWHLFGDEGAYAISGEIKNKDISENAEIAQSKIENLVESLEEKVSKTEIQDDKTKLYTIYEGDWENTIEHILVNGSEVMPDEEKIVSLNIPVFTDEQIENINNWQPNPIDHIFINGVEADPITYKTLPKSINIEHVLTEEETLKLENIEPLAQVNKIEAVRINSTLFSEINNNKELQINLNSSVLGLNIIEGARYPSTNSYVDIEVTDKKLELSKVAATGNINDLIQSDNSYIILNCGTSANNINEEVES